MNERKLNNFDEIRYRISIAMFAATMSTLETQSTIGLQPPEVSHVRDTLLNCLQEIFQ